MFTMKQACEQTQLPYETLKFSSKKDAHSFFKMSPDMRPGEN